jgi:hypothetical protein
VFFYNCDEKYFLGNKCKEQKFFMAISEDVFEDDIEASHAVKIHDLAPITPPYNPPEVELVISLNALICFSTSQTLKLIGYIKKKKVIILIESGITHNFIHGCISEETHFYIHVVNNFQIMIACGGSMKCRRHCENVSLNWPVQPEISYVHYRHGWL